MAGQSSQVLEQLLAGVRSFFLPYSRTTNPEERRQLVRVRSHIPVQVKVGNKLQSAVVVDLGVQGLRLRSGFSLSSYTHVPVLHTEGVGVKNPVVRCRVAWCRRLKKERNYSSGLVYDDTPENMRHSWVAIILRELGLDDKTIHERREFIRAAGQVAVKLERRDEGSRRGEAPRVEAVNVGVGGLLLRTKSIVRSGEKFLVELGPALTLPPLRGLTAEAVKCTADSSDGGYLVALHFIEPDARQVRALGAYVLALLREA